MNLGLRSLGSASISSTPTPTSMLTSTMLQPSSPISSITPTSPSAVSTSVLVSPTSSHPSPSPSPTMITHQSSSVSFTSSPHSQKSPPPPPSPSTATLLASHSFSSNTTTSSPLTPSSTSSSSSSNNNPLEVSAAALQTSDNVTTFFPTNTMLTFPSVPSSVSQCVTTCLQNAIVSVNCVTITSVECYCGKPQFVSNTYNCVESQCPADFNQAENIAEEFCALVSTSLTFPSPTATFAPANSTASNTASTALQPKALSAKLLVSSFTFMMALYALQN